MRLPGASSAFPRRTKSPIIRGLRRTFELPVRTGVNTSERERERLSSRAIQSSISALKRGEFFGMTAVTFRSQTHRDGFTQRSIARARAHRALRADGTYLMQDISGTSHVYKDIDHPIGTFLYVISCMHCMTVSLAQGGEGLGAMWGEERRRECLTRAGFRSVTTHRLPHDIQNNWYVVTK